MEWDCVFRVYLAGSVFLVFRGPFLVTLLLHATRGRWLAALLRRSGFRLHGFTAGAKQVGVSRSIVVVVLVGF